jgi:hypothetical protein
MKHCMPFGLEGTEVACKQQYLSRHPIQAPCHVSKIPTLGLPPQKSGGAVEVKNGHCHRLGRKKPLNVS